MTTKYPKQGPSIKRDSKVLAVDVELYTPLETEDVPPLDMHSGFSRFIMTIVDTSSGTAITPKANIPVDDLDAIIKKTDISMYCYMLDSSESVATENSTNGSAVPNSPAYTQKLAGKDGDGFKGRTPAEILIADPNQMDALLRKKAWLEANVGKYPGNKNQIAAIDDAIALLTSGELVPTGSETTTPQNSKKGRILEIYHKEFKHLSRKNEKGDSLIYSIDIRYDGSRSFPFIVTITNCFAPLKVDSKKMCHPVMEQATNHTKSVLYMSDEEWLAVVGKMERLRAYFENDAFPQQHRKAVHLARPDDVPAEAADIERAIAIVHYLSSLNEGQWKNLMQRFK